MKRWKIGDRVFVCGKHPGTIVDFFESYGRTTYSVLFDDEPYSRVPPQTAIGVREHELKKNPDTGGRRSAWPGG